MVLIGIRMIKIEMIITVLILAGGVCHGQRNNIKFGKITKEEMEMRQYSKDTTAKAVVLNDVGYFRNSNFTFTRHLRVKIFDHGGTGFANFVIQAPDKSFIKGVTYNLEGGTISETKLKNDNIFLEKIIEDYELYKIFFPNVKPGSVIDLEYSHRGLPFEWRFQNIIPIIYNELTIEPTTNVTFKKVFYGFEQIKPIKDNQWVAEDVPALIMEPYMSHYSNYLTRFEMEINSIFFPGYLYREFATSWQKVGERLLEFIEFGDIIKGCGFLNDKGKQLEKSTLSTEEKIEEAFNYIRENIKWNNVESAFVTKDYRENFLKNHSGNSAEVNLLLIALLKKAGIDAEPVVLSTRDNGILNPSSASLRKINYVVGHVNLDGKTMLLDATSPHSVPGVLPTRCLNVSGWLVHKTAGHWVDLNQGYAEVKKKFVRIYPDEDNQFHAEVSNTFEEYAYLDWVNKFEEEGSEEEYAKYIAANIKNLEIENYSLRSNNADDLKSNDFFSINISNSDYIQDIGSELILNPFVLNEIGENPFKSESRRFPIDLIYPKHHSVIVSITLPEGYSVNKLPGSYRMVTDGEAAQFGLYYEVNNNIINVRYDLKINETIFPEDQYPTIKNFFGELLRIINQPIQLNKKT